MVNDSQTFYETCVKHLQKPLVQPADTCQHYILTCEYHNKLGKRPSTVQLLGIPETHKFHQIGNTIAKLYITGNLHVVALDVFMEQNHVPMILVHLNGQDMI